MNIRQILTDEVSEREEYSAPDYQRLVFETCVLNGTSTHHIPDQSEDDETDASGEW